MTGRRPKVVHLTSVHPPLDTRVFWKECRTLAQAGYEVVLVAPDPPVAEKDGVRFIGHVRPRSRVDRVLRTPLRVFLLARRERAAVYHFHDPDLLPVGVLLALVTRCPVVYDSHEDVPRQLLERVWIPERLRPLAAAVAREVERFCVRFLTAVISAEPGGTGRFPPGKAILVQNFPLLEEFPPSPVAYEDRENVVVYVGDVTKARGAEVMVRAMGLLPAEMDARLVIAGKCQVPGLLDELARLEGWERVHLLGWLTREQVRDLLHRAKVGLVVMQPTAQYREATQPVKLFEYMAAGLPVVASDFPDLRRFTESGCAVVDPTCPRDVADAVRRILENPGDARRLGEVARAAVTEQWSWASEGSRLVKAYAGFVR